MHIVVTQEDLIEVMDYIEMKPERFVELCDKARSPHLWKRLGDTWQLRHRLS